MAHNHDGVPDSTSGPATKFPLVPNTLYIRKELAIGELIDFLYMLNILRCRWPDTHGYVHRITGLNFYIEDNS